MKMTKQHHSIAQNYTTATGTFYGQIAEIRPSFYDVNLGIRYDINVIGYSYTLSWRGACGGLCAEGVFRGKEDDAIIQRKRIKCQ